MHSYSNCSPSSTTKLQRCEHENTSPSTLARTLIAQPRNEVKGSGLGCENAFGLLMC